jgi:hypothetical protein
MVSRLRFLIAALAVVAVPSTCLALPIIDIHKLVNGIESVTPPGPMVPVGSTLTFTYLVDNDGDESLTGVSVRDDNGTPLSTADDFFPTFVGGDVDANGLLGINEEWTFVASRIATEGPFQNVAVTSGIGTTTGFQTADAAVAHHVGVRQPVPEPSAWILLGAGVMAVAWRRVARR